MSKWEYVQLCGYYDHPNANSNGVILEHRLVMSEYLGRPLEDDEWVHHCDENQKHNEIENLELMFKIEHSSTGREMVTLICPVCEISFDRPKNQTHLIKKRNRTTCCSRSCSGKYGNIRKAELA